MLAGLPSLKSFRLWAALLLGVIGLQATTSATPSAQARSGSAFSAATYEVALYVQRGDRTQRQAVTPMADGAVVLPSRPQPPVAVVQADPAAVRPDPTGPPLRDIHSWEPAARAPPRA